MYGNSAFGDKSILEAATHTHKDELAVSTNVSFDDPELDRLLSQYDQYEERFERPSERRRTRRKQKAPLNYQQRRLLETQAVNELADEASGLEGGFRTTYQPGRLEERWLYDSLRPFFELELISDVTAVVKGGKEANVYRCAGAAGSQTGSVAAKVYRPRMFRNLRNDAMYRQGRETLTAGGTPVKETEHRVIRAIGKKTGFGQQVAHTSWLMHEYKTLEALYAAGAAVPRPFGTTDNAILMGFVGDEQVAAPALSEVNLPVPLARILFEEALRNIALLLEHGLVHGDLSAYNILYWEEDITLIDFPQVMRVRSASGEINNNAHNVLQRDIRRICQYFRRQGVRADAENIAAELWRRHVHEVEEFTLADLSRYEADSEDDEPAAEE